MACGKPQKATVFSLALFSTNDDSLLVDFCCWKLFLEEFFVLTVCIDTAARPVCLHLSPKSVLLPTLIFFPGDMRYIHEQGVTVKLLLLGHFQKD